MTEFIPFAPLLGAARLAATGLVTSTKVASKYA